MSDSLMSDLLYIYGSVRLLSLCITIHYRRLGASCLLVLLAGGIMSISSISARRLVSLLTNLTTIYKDITSKTPKITNSAVMAVINLFSVKMFSLSSPILFLDSSTRPLILEEILSNWLSSSAIMHYSVFVLTFCYIAQHSLWKIVLGISFITMCRMYTQQNKLFLFTLI